MSSTTFKILTTLALLSTVLAPRTAAAACGELYTPIYQIQGNGPTAAITGNVTTEGVVVGDYEYPGSGSANSFLRGFYLQDATGDGDAATSDGIFVFNGNYDSVSVGDIVRVTGTAEEFQGQTQIGSLTGIEACATGTVTPTDVTFPVPTTDYLERYEGMLVRLPQTMYVTEHFQLGRFGQVVLSANARLQQPTNVTTPGTAALALQAQNDLNRIILDDASQAQNPDPIVFARGGGPLSASNTLRGGDTAVNIVGVMTYTWAGNAASGNAYRVRPINAMGGAVDFQPVNARPSAAPIVGGTLRVAGINLLNFFNTYDGLPDSVDNCTNGVGGTSTDCRGADTSEEFDRQYPKTVATILASEADVLGFVEIENDGYDSSSAIAFLADQLNAVTGSGTYDFIEVDDNTSQINALGTDAIKVGLIYKPAVVSPVGQTAALNTEAFINGGDSEPRNRASLAQAFQVNATGARFIVSVNHLKSKGSACDTPDAADGQGNCNQVRVNAVTELLSWLATDPTATGDPDVLLIGDYNSYALEDPIITAENAGFTNLIATFLGFDAYGYVFDGQWGYLDQALASPSLVSQVTGVGVHHANADEPSVLDYNVDFKTPNLQTTLYAPDEFRSSDHDPIVVGLDLAWEGPSIESITAAPTPAAVNAAVTAFATFAYGDATATHTATIDWADGVTTPGSISEGGGTGTVTGTHSYSVAGVYPVTVVVEDDSGATDSATFEYVVVYDPSAGFVSGGGWIWSPAGAYRADESLDGQASFGFVSKYQKGASAPKGTTTFRFDAAGFAFDATAYDWLVISGSKAQYKGTGTVNGAGSYTFLLSANDSPDTLRLKVWYTDATGDHTVYDNGTDQPVGAGAIMVHKAK